MPSPSIGGEGAGGPRLLVAPELAEEIAWRAILRAEAAGRPEVRARHHERAAAAYALPPGPARDRAFGDLAIGEVAELGLLDPLRAAVAERPDLAAGVELVLLARALGPAEETVTCDRSRRRIGLRVRVDRFDDPARLRAWARHALGHAEDSLDPSFGFEPGWELRTDGPTAERLHVLWDASVDGRAARAGRPVFGTTRQDHADRLAALLPPGHGPVAAALVERCWTGDRPDFPTLRRWAAAPLAAAGVLAGDGSGAAPDPIDRPADPAVRLLPGGRCPLCRFPSVVLHEPEPPIADRIAAAHPVWRAELGCCERCHDRYRLAPPPHPRAAGSAAGPSAANLEVLR
jgi:hypothetical protein